jgi:thiol-disulfide isomerase/thioredoxin
VKLLCFALLALAPLIEQVDDVHGRIQGEERAAAAFDSLRAAELLAPLRPSLASVLLEEALGRGKVSRGNAQAALIRRAAALDPERTNAFVESLLQPEAAYEALIRFYIEKGEYDSAIRAARRAKERGLATLQADEELLRALVKKRSPEASALLSEVLAALPAAIAEPRDLLFVLRSVSVTAPADAPLAAQAAERVVGSLERATAASAQRDELLLSAGAYLAALDRRRYGWHRDSLKRWSDQLDRLSPPQLLAVAAAPLRLPPRSPDPAAATPGALDLRALADAVARESDLTPLHEFRGRFVLLTFWATWCPPCRRELPRLDQIARSAGAGNLAVLGISNEQPTLVDAYLHQSGSTFTSLIDASNDVFRRYEVSALPVTVIFDRNGRLVRRLSGECTSEDLRAALTEAGLRY